MSGGEKHPGTSLQNGSRVIMTTADKEPAGQINMDEYLRELERRVVQRFPRLARPQPLRVFTLAELQAGLTKEGADGE